MIQIDRIWFCSNCGCRHDWQIRKPKIIAYACVFYRSYGRPPFAAIGNPSNANKPIIAEFRYCC